MNPCQLATIRLGREDDIGNKSLNKRLLTRAIIKSCLSGPSNKSAISTLLIQCPLMGKPAGAYNAACGHKADIPLDCARTSSIGRERHRRDDLNRRHPRLDDQRGSGWWDRRGAGFPSRRPPMTTTRKSQPAKASAKVTDAPADSGARRAPTKTDQLLALLQTPDGVSIEELSDRFCWLQHTTRAAFTSLRKKGHAVIRGKQGSVTVYRIGG